MGPRTSATFQVVKTRRDIGPGKLSSPANRPESDFNGFELSLPREDHPNCPKSASQKVNFSQ